LTPTNLLRRFDALKFAKTDHCYFSNPSFGWNAKPCGLVDLPTSNRNTLLWDSAATNESF